MEHALEAFTFFVLFFLGAGFECTVVDLTFFFTLKIVEVGV